MLRLVGRERDTLAPALSLRRSPLGVRARALTAGRVLRLDLHPADFDRPRRVLALEAVLRGASRPARGHVRRAGPGAVCPRGRRGSDVSVKLLVLTPEPVDADRLRDTVGPEVEGAEVLVVSPATNQSRLAFWVSDSDEAIAEAEQAEERTVESLESAGVDASGDTGESEPAVALQDALATFAADRIVIFEHPAGRPRRPRGHGPRGRRGALRDPGHAGRDRALTGLTVRSVSTPRTTNQFVLVLSVRRR